MSNIKTKKCDWREDEYVAYSEEYLAIEFGNSKEEARNNLQEAIEECDLQRRSDIEGFKDFLEEVFGEAPKEYSEDDFTEFGENIVEAPVPRDEVPDSGGEIQ